MCRFCDIRIKCFDPDKEKTRENFAALDDYDLEGLIADSTFKAIQYDVVDDKKGKNAHSAFAELALEVYFDRHNLPKNGEVSVVFDADREVLINSTQPRFPKELKDKVPPMNFKTHEMHVAIFGKQGAIESMKESLTKAGMLKTGVESGEFIPGNPSPEQIGKALDAMLGPKKQSPMTM